MDEARLRELGAVLIPASAMQPTVSDENVPNIYTNSTQMRVSVHDFVLTLGVAEPFGEENRTRAVARIIMSPQHAKAVTEILQKQLRLYEETFGPIPVSPVIGDSASEGMTEDGTQDEP
jgi:hypothetical protein